jgi:formate dehydrogenase major subunit
MNRGEIKGLILLGQNPAVGGPNSKLERGALDKLDWMVAVDVWETETANFWRRPDGNSANIKTEVFMLPAASSMEKEGSVSNSGRWAQWRYEAAHPPGAAKSDLWILTRLHRKLKEQYASKGGAYPHPITQLSWEVGATEEPNPHNVAREINGYFLEDVEIQGVKYKKGDLVPAFALLQADGKTSSGNWLYCSSYTNNGNMMARRKRSNAKVDPIGLHPEWSWCWPVNRRIIYNRASCDAQGRPWAPRKAVVAYDWQNNRWVGDVPDGPWPPPRNPDNSVNPAGRHAFIMQSEGLAYLYAPQLVDGPFPEHYEPLESPVSNQMSKQQVNPCITIWQPKEIGQASEYPIVATTYRVCEHWQTGPMTRNLPWLVELMPEAFVEMGVELARERGITSGDRVKIRTPRGEIELPAVVTKRMPSLRVAGKRIHQVGIIWHFGYTGLATGPSANILTPHVGDPNTQIPEFKAFLCDVNRIGSGRVA